MRAGVANVLVDPVSLGVICGLVIGKPLGILLFSWLATRCRVATMLTGVNWLHILGLGMLAGIGFTMSLFIANLAFGDTLTLQVAKLGILAASVISGIAGAIVLLKQGRHNLLV
jgi:NhaA family Na+:H+ antiporter